jgi:FlaA1/EpsC-like NDP-sugar epimerase
MVRRLSAHLMKNVVIFGAGDGGRRVWECVCRGARAHVLFFVDNDPRKHGLRFLSADVRAPEALGEGGFDLVLVASIYADEITAQLDSLGVPRDLVRVFELSAGDEALDRAVAAALPVPAVPAVSSHGVVARVGIFGTGQGGMRVWEALMGLDHIEPAWFCDNDVRKQGRPFLWLEVIPPAEIPRRLADYVIVASMYREPITRQLIGLGVPGERILTPSVTTNVDTIRRELASALPARTLIA